MYPLVDWPYEPPRLFEGNRIDLLGGSGDDKDEILQYNKLEEFIKSSDKFPIKFPIETGRCKTLKNRVDEFILLGNVNSSYPVLHECVIPLYIDFILYKRQFGSRIEKKLYESMNFLDFVDRLLKKRAVMFMGRNDEYILLDGKKGRAKWETIGTDAEEGALILKNCLSYDEIKLSALLSVSSLSCFINDGNRKNKGVPQQSNVEGGGVIIGLIGARLKKHGFMEYQDLVIEEKQNLAKNGYGANAPSLPGLYANFYNKLDKDYYEFCIAGGNAKRNADKYYRLARDILFDNITYSKRVTIPIDTLLCEANYRAKINKTSAFIHVVGIGLGVWKCSDHQEEIFIETFLKRIELLAKYLHNVSDVFFSYFTYVRYHRYNKPKIPLEGHPNEGIRIFFEDREPHSMLVNENKGKLLVVSYAWDGNALPGNEFWSGKLSSTGDSAAASSTQIAEIHNPHINRNVCARNLKIAARGEIYNFADYLEYNKQVKRTAGVTSTPISFSSDY